MKKWIVWIAIMYMLSACVRGSGGATLWVTDSLEGRISGNGSASYYGDPEPDVSTSGSGRAKALGDK